MAREEIGIDLKGLLFAHADDRIYARFLQQSRAAPMHTRIGIYDSDDALRDARLYQRCGTGRSLAVMRARL